jgi:hypothetical protein
VQGSKTKEHIITYCNHVLSGFVNSECTLVAADLLDNHYDEV